MNNTMETRMMKLMKGLMWSMGILFAIIMVLGISRAFYSSFLESGSSPTETATSPLEEARDWEKAAENAESPQQEIEYRLRASQAYVEAGIRQPFNTFDLAAAMAPRIRELQQEHKLPKAAPNRGLCLMFDEAKGDFSCLAAHVQSGIYDFSADSNRDARDYASTLLCDMLEFIDWHRYGSEVQQLKPIVISLLQQGARTTWPDLWNWHKSTDAVLTAVRTRDAEFLRAVLDCGLPASGINGDKKPECEALWQNSPDLIEILQSN